MIGKITGELRDDHVISKIGSIAGDPDYWDFRHGAGRSALHAVSQYPAMMVPAMQGKLLDIFCDVIGGDINAIDPFLGSGTTLLEGMRRGINFWGQDINPLAVLISLCKVGPFAISDLEAAVQRVNHKALKDKIEAPAVDFRGRDKWFEPSIIRTLSKIHRAIRDESNLWVRRMLWVSLAETIRQTSKSRTSTFKLHIRPPEELALRRSDALKIFADVSKRAISRSKEEYEILCSLGHLKGSSYARKAQVCIGHSNKKLPGVCQFDLLVTSPPYGDGTSTVPYGQYSFLPLQWIDLADISEVADSSCLKSTAEIDSRSLGGSRRNALQRVKSVVDESAALENYLRLLKKFPSDRSKRVGAFFADFAQVLSVVCRRMQVDGYLVWTVGNRCVGGLSQPLDEILSELLSNRGCKLVTKIDRRIPNKRMAPRNSISMTMRKEHTLIFRMVGL